MLLVVPTSLNSQASTSGHYAVTFRETGLPNGTRWFVSDGNFTQYSNNSTITLYEPNGTYNFIFGGAKDYKPLPSNFTLVVKGTNMFRVIVWVLVLYPITFVESGLPSGTLWNVTLGTKSNTTSNSSIIFHVRNGTYNYTIPDINGITSSTPNGTLKVNGGPVKVFVAFTFPITFTFYEKGFPKGAKWSVFIDGTYYNSTSSFITVTLANGTYSYLIIAPSNYEVTPASGTVNYSNDLISVKATSLLTYESALIVLVLLIGLFLSIYLRARIKTKKQTKIEEGPEKKR